MMNVSYRRVIFNGFVLEIITPLVCSNLTECFKHVTLYSSLINLINIDWRYQNTVSMLISVSFLVSNAEVKDSEQLEVTKVPKMKQSKWRMIVRQHVKLFPCLNNLLLGFLWTFRELIETVYFSTGLSTSWGINLLRNASGQSLSESFNAEFANIF